jgi:penicillin-binding protein 2
MGKFLGLCFFVAGLAAIYVWGVQPLLRQSATSQTTTPIVLSAQGSPTPVVLTADAQHAAGAAESFFRAWSAGQYAQMYDLLTVPARGRITQQAFTARYRAVMAEATVQHVTGQVLSVHLSTPTATVAFQDTFRTGAVGTFTQHNTMHLILEHGHWHVDWYPALIFKQLEDPYIVHLTVLRARRGSILDRNGTPLAEDGQFWTIGVVPGRITDETMLLTYLSNWLHLSPATIKHFYTLPWAQPDYFMPITTITNVQYQAAPPGLQNLMNNDGVALEATPGRVYPNGSVAGILVGYVDPTTHQGKTGLEQALNSILAGKDGAQLAVMNQAETMVAAVIAKRPAIPGRDVRLTIDLRVQKAAERQLGIRPGAAVAIDPATGAILALASTPGYDPNRFEVGATATTGIGPIRSSFSRATLGTYPIGSIFKIVTMAAGLEKAGYTAQTMISGPGVWYGLGPNDPLHDWLPSGHGVISLQEALVQSCDTCFYQVAQKLDGINQNILPAFARAFGFGSPTGVPYLSEAPGLVGDNAYKERVYHDAWRTGDTINMAIGQGFFLATPLQTANMLAAVGDGGIRHEPQLILSIGGKKVFKPIVVGHLPVSAAHLQSILAGMLGVTTEPTGTATFVFRNFPWQVDGKTGTAQAPGAQKPHAWFAALAPAAKPRIALAVVVENGGEGSYVAAPVAREILRTFLTLPVPAPPASQGPTHLTVPGA